MYKDGNGGEALHLGCLTFDGAKRKSHGAALRPLVPRRVQLAEKCVPCDRGVGHMNLMNADIRCLAPLAFLALVGCNSPEVGAATGELKSAAKAAAGDVIKEATGVAGGLVTTTNACLLAGQSEALCGCLGSELGQELDAKHIEGLSGALKAGLGGDVDAAIKEASNIDPETRAALAKCGTRAAIAGAVGQ
jgi:hypothetical protein